MKEQIDVSFTKEEWNAISILVRRQLQGTNIEEFEEKRLRLKNILQSYEREKNSLERDEIISKTFASILDKIDTKI